MLIACCTLASVVNFNFIELALRSVRSSINHLAALSPSTLFWDLQSDSPHTQLNPASPAHNFNLRNRH